METAAGIRRSDSPPGSFREASSDISELAPSSVSEGLPIQRAINFSVSGKTGLSDVKVKSKILFS